jgi:hypothetical protein
MKFLIIVLCVNFVYIYGLTLKRNIMKKITLLLSILLIGFTSHAQFPQNFDGGVIPATWAVFAGDGETTTVQAWTSGLFTDGITGYALCQYEGAGFETQDWLVSPLTAIESTNSLLGFNERNPYGAAYDPTTMSIRVSTTSQTDISSFTTLSSLTSAEVFAGTGTRSVDLSAYEGQDIYIAWVLTQNDTDGWLIDSLELQNPNASAPDQCINMVPADESTVDLILSGENRALVFSWDPATTGDPATSYEISVGTNSGGAPWIGTLAASPGLTLSFGGIPDTTYYWQINSINAGGSALSSIYSFTTSSADPLGVEGFTIEALSVSPNPVKDVITINSPVGFDSVKVFNQLGQLVIESNSSLINNNRLDLSALNPGMYLVKINADNKSKTVKIIKE